MQVGKHLNFVVYREGLSEPMPQRCDLLAGRRVNVKGRQRMLSGPNGNSSSSSSSMGSSERYCDRMRGERVGWRPYRIPRPKLLSMGHCSRHRTVSATLHEEPDGRLPPILDASPIASATDAIRSMAIEDNKPCRTIVSHLTKSRKRSTDSFSSSFLRN